MSSTTQAAVLGTLAREPGAGERRGHQVQRPLVRLVAFAALGLFGALRWGTLMNPAPTWRLLGLLAVAVALAGIGPMVIERERAVAALAGRSEAVSALAGPLAVLAVLAIFPIAGVPLAWTIHLRVAVSADQIGQGLSALPGILVPYTGINQWVRVGMLLGAAVLLLDAAMLLAFSPRALGDMRRAGVALPLIALVVVPAVSLHPSLAYLQGLVLFGLLALFMWGERVAPDRRGGVVLACVATGALGMILAPVVDQHSPWINTQNLARGLTPAHAEQFNWAQGYGPLIWPRTGDIVLDVQATPKVWSGEYWKAENLDTFDGRGWATAGADTAQPPPLPAKTLARWTQNLTVTIRSMQTANVVAAGTAFQQPDHLPGPALPGASAGTWTSEAVIGPGDSYTVQVYVPHPSAASLARAGEDYPFGALQADLAVALPQNTPGVRPQTVVFPPFSSRSNRPAPFDQTRAEGTSGTTAIANSVYAPAYALAQRLENGVRTPYTYVQKVLAYLDSGRFSYDEYPPRAAYPLETFLFSSQIGYCQQFAGAMALLLRMGGIPARVATGFTTGIYDTATHQWLVSDIDAHAWVEAWFPHYGWITFDPTPAAAPARGGRSSINSNSFLGGAGGLSKLGGRNVGTSGSVGIGGAHPHGGGSVAAPILFGALGVLLVLLVLSVVAWRRSGASDADGLLAELERALARVGRPISGGVTLAALEQRFRTSPDAAAYVHALRMARFGGATGLPTLHQRRALRAQLRAGLGLTGTIRALWALPPRPRRAPGGHKPASAV